jgi:hypothetical protein
MAWERLQAMVVAMKYCDSADGLQLPIHHPFVEHER